MISPILINGYAIFPFQSKIQFLEYIEYGNFNKILVSINAEILIKTDNRLKSIVNHNIGFADGFGAVKVLQKKGNLRAIKIPGCEFWLDIVMKFHASKSFYLVGGTKNVILKTVEKLNVEYPGINILGYRDGYINDTLERNKLLKEIREKKPDIVFIAMGVPLQEYLMEDMQQFNSGALYMGLGGSFDVYTGKVDRAPEWWVKNKLEWAYRLVREPKRIKRQIHLVKFLRYLF